MNEASIPMTSRTYVLALAPAASVAAAVTVGAVFSAPVLAGLVMLGLWAPHPLGLGVRLLDKDLDAHEDMLMSKATLGQRLRAYAWLWTSRTPVGQDLRFMLGGFILAGGTLLLTLSWI